MMSESIERFANVTELLKKNSNNDTDNVVYC